MLVGVLCLFVVSGLSWFGCVGFVLLLLVCVVLFVVGEGLCLVRC